MHKILGDRIRISDFSPPYCSYWIVYFIFLWLNDKLCRMYGLWSRIFAGGAEGPLKCWRLYDSISNLCHLETRNKWSSDYSPSSGFTPLHDAAWNGHDSTVKLLLERGANFEVRTTKGEDWLGRVALGDVGVIAIGLYEVAIRLKGKDFFFNFIICWYCYSKILANIRWYWIVHPYLLLLNVKLRRMYIIWSRIPGMTPAMLAAMKGNLAAWEILTDAEERTKQLVGACCDV